MGEKAYKKQQAQKKREYRAKIKQSKTPQEQQKLVVQQVVQQVVQNVAPAIVKDVTQETKGKIANFFKPVSKDQGKITDFFDLSQKKNIYKILKLNQSKI
jgi:hypothetical protein